eukprot:CAMPEP_0119101112 /NCGR_PEP_ID=MMETSP1180-20130426/248_1 /TAXON_ID=3052 ORGANISM="Chlamydomonas cf sp, Strain CCMP681" /NCGR_SAMPLE_ID=MMETSP1180 /ASSEMBLY_ACC=CAM_ASM_000741 /LENGTH=66 /DNA_ID=CAMNT_0007085167 /DNA_START=41 /DNA_END=241 /DNA_ORIENTATION=-
MKQHSNQGLLNALQLVGKKDTEEQDGGAAIIGCQGPAGDVIIDALFKVQDHSHVHHFDGVNSWETD